MFGKMDGEYDTRRTNPYELASHTKIKAENNLALGLDLILAYPLSTKKVTVK